MNEAAHQGHSSTRTVPETRAGKGCSAFLGVWRMVILCSMFAAAGLHYLVTASGPSLVKRAHWLHRWSRRCVRLLGMNVEKVGMTPRIGLVVANHVSYLDIVVLSALAPSLFVAKNDVARWPVLGLFARMSGTIFIDRTRRLDVARTAVQLKIALGAGLPVVIFPEGTSSDGRDVLPFKSSLLQPACEGAFPITPVAIDYTVAEGAAGDLVCYWGEMTLLPHLLKLLTLRQIGVYLTFGSASSRNFHRKALAIQLRQEIVALRSFHPERTT